MNRYAAIGEALEALGVSIPTVRRWERKGTVIPERTAGRSCPECGTDRNVNAAITLKNKDPTVSACGEEGSGRKTGTKPASTKRESNTQHPMGRFGAVWVNGLDCLP